MIERIARKVADQAFDNMLSRLGVNVDEFVEFQKDFAHLRAWRLSVEAAKRQTLVGTVGVLVAGLLGLIWMAVRGQ